MSGKRDQMQALRLYVDLKKRADAGDPRAKLEVAKIAANPTAVAVLRRLADSVKSAQALALVATLTQPTEVVVGEDEYEAGADDLEDAAHAHRQLPPGADDLDHKALLRKVRQANQNNVAPAVNTNPPSVFTGSMGNSQSVTTGDNPVQVALWQGAAEETRAISATFSAAFVPDALAAGAVKPFGIITFGNRGFVATAEVDIGQGGCQLTVAASAVTLQVGMDPAAVGENNATLLLSGMLGFNTIVRTAPLTRTLYLDGAQTTASGALRIPAFAKAVWLERSKLSDALTMNIQNAGLATLSQFALLANAYQTWPIILPNDAFYISITGGDGTGKARLIFELGL